MLATILQIEKSSLRRLQESCKWEKELFGACNNLASEKKTFWRLQDCCKHFQKHFGCYSALSKTFFWDKEPHFLSPNPHFITWETNISIESNQDQSKYTSHKYPRVFPRELSLCRKWWRYEKLSCPSQIRRFPSLAIYVLATRNTLKPKFISCLHLRDRK